MCGKSGIIIQHAFDPQGCLQSLFVLSHIFLNVLLTFFQNVCVNFILFKSGMAVVRKIRVIPVELALLETPESSLTGRDLSMPERGGTDLNKNR